jgi:signal transduction histidine kinase
MYDLTQQREMDKKRDEMIHFIMHELKNPLSGLAGIIEILQDDTLGKETTGFYFNLIENNVNKLFTLTNRFLEVIKLENNEIQIVKESLDLKQELDNLNTSFFAQMQEKNITLKIELIPPVEIIYASNHHFQDILSNILSNAIKYGPESRSIYIQAKQNDKKSTVLSFTDYGYGIDKSELDHIFEKFYRIKRMDSETGTGLGLTYVKKMIEAHGGHVEVESNEEIGTKFTLTFPNR